MYWLSTVPGLTNIYPAHQHLPNTSKFIGLVNIYRPGQHLLDMSTFTGLVNIYRTCQHLLDLSTFTELVSIYCTVIYCDLSSWFVNVNDHFHKIRIKCIHGYISQCSAILVSWFDVDCIHCTCIVYWNPSRPRLELNFKPLSFTPFWFSYSYTAFVNLFKSIFCPVV